MATLVAVNRMVRASVRVGALRKVWIHSLATAVIAEEAARVARMERESAYTAGLLHNLGTLGMMSAYPDEYSRMLEVSDDFGFDLLTTERDLFEIDHCAAGAYLAQDWGFPDELAAVIATHHDEPVPGEFSLYNLIKVSWRLSDTLGYAAFSPDKQWSWEELIACLPNAAFFLARRVAGRGPRRNSRFVLPLRPCRRLCDIRAVRYHGRRSSDMAQKGFSRRHFFFGSLLAGAVPTAGFGSDGFAEAPRLSSRPMRS